MKRLYEAIVKKLSHEHNFELVKELSVRVTQVGSSAFEDRKKQYYMCKSCGEIRVIDMGA